MAEYLDLDKIRAYCAAATQGPWEIVALGGTTNPAVLYDKSRHLRLVVDHSYDFATPDHDAVFIAGARTDLPRCLAVIEALRAALRLAHACATLRPDGTCEGCVVSTALALVTGGTDG